MVVDKKHIVSLTRPTRSMKMLFQVLSKKLHHTLAKLFGRDHTPPHFFEGSLKDLKERLFYYK
ncbi:hypothetical protein [Holospora elegans]|uniref:hypothetical protein n=1 Tax=Holospora elegans TaxID=431043 RepID=UPI00139F2C86|nr:hypothetical protein [Holospora elegans]